MKTGTGRLESDTENKGSSLNRIACDNYNVNNIFWFEQDSTKQPIKTSIPNYLLRF